jgi:hypothetical protein
VTVPAIRSRKALTARIASNSPMKSAEKTLESIKKNLVVLNKNLKNQNSFKRGFLFSVLQGVGSVIGATIVAGLILFILSKFIHSVEQIPFIGNLIKSSQLEQTINTKLPVK